MAEEKQNDKPEKENNKSKNKITNKYKYEINSDKPKKGSFECFVANYIYLFQFVVSYR